MNWLDKFLNKSNRRIKIHYLIAVLFIALFLTIGIPTLARYKNRSSINDTTLWDGSIATSYKSGSGTSSDPYVISNGSEFAYFAQELNNTDYEDNYFILDNDILLNDGLFNYSKDDGLSYTKDNNTISITPYLDNYSDINLFQSISSFKGHLDGKSYSIYGLFITSNDESLALFKNLEGEIKDLYLENTVIYGGYDTAGIAVNSEGASLTNVLLNGYIIGNSNTLATSKVVNIDDISKSISSNTNEIINIDLPIINGIFTSAKLSGNYTTTNDSATLRINNTEISSGYFEVDLGSLTSSLNFKYKTNSDTTFELSNLEYSINYNYGYSSGIIGNTNNTNLNGVINKASVYGSFNSNGLVNVLSGTSTIINSYNRGNITSINNSNGLVNIITNNTTSITVTYSYNSGVLTSNESYGFVNRIVDNTGNIGIGRCFNTTGDYFINEVSNTDLLINSVATLTSGIKNGTSNGSVEIVSDFVEFSKNNGFNEFVDLEDLTLNSSNLWVYDDLPVLYIDDINNPVASINISKYSWNNLGYKLHTVKFGSSFNFTITSVDNVRPIKETYYYISKSKTPLRKSEITSISSWIQYNSQVTIEEEGFYVIYVKVVDYNDEVFYLNSDLLVLDLSASYINITMNEENWDSLNDNLEDIYLNTNASVSISAIDELSGVKSINYYLSDHFLSFSEVENIDSWSIYTEPVTIDASSGKVIYVKVVDNTDYVSYANSSKIVIDGYKQVYLKAGKNIAYSDNLIINSKSSVSMNYTFSDNNTYKEGYNHKIISNMNIPKNTIVTLIDNNNSRAYRYIVSEETSEILFNKFSEIGGINSNKYSEYTTGKINDNFTINLDFSKTDLSSNIDNLKVYMVLLDGNKVIRPIMNSTVDGFSVYINNDYTVNLTSDYTNTIYYNTENTYNIGFKTTYTTSNNAIDTTLEGKSIGLALRVIDSNDNVIEKSNLRNITFIYDGKKYSAGSDNIIRINLNNGLNNTNGTIKVDTSIDNIKLESGTYKLQLGYFIASDGLYSDDITYTKTINLSVTNNSIKKNYLFNVSMNNNDRIISIDGNKKINFKVLLNSDLDNPIVRISLYKKSDLSAYSQSYTKIDLSKYIITNLNLYNNLIYNTAITSNSSEYRNLDIEFDTAQFNHTGYKLVFDLYNGDTKIDSIFKNIIVK